MLRVKLRFPLGVYHARSASDEAEWPPSPLRLIGALLAAAHERPCADPERDRALLQRLCEEPAPRVVAPDSIAVGEPVGAGEAVRLRGATRWAPRNYVTGPVSPRNIGRDRAEVSKVGVAIGDRTVLIEWPDLELDDEDLERLAILASEVTFVGTTRSPAILEIQTTPALAQEDADDMETWVPSTGAQARLDVTLRVPDARAISAFDRRHQARRSRRDRVEKAGMVPEIAIGTPMPYLSARRRRLAEAPLDPQWWGEMILLEVDQPQSDLLPKAAASYLLARAVRVMVLGAFDKEGTAGEAPSILRARGGDPHCAIVPLPHVWGEHPDGCIRGVALIPPHATREPDVQTQLRRVEGALRTCVGGTPDAAPRYVKLPGAGKITLKLPDVRGARLESLREAWYLGPAQSWVTVTPIVHSRWRKGGVDALLEQVSADCAHVGLPAPAEIELLRGAGRRGGADRVTPPPASCESWRGLLQGPTSHMRLTFAQPVRGPLLIGRARHFGLGLCVPDNGATEGRRG